MPVSAVVDITPETTRSAWHNPLRYNILSRSPQNLEVFHNSAEIRSLLLLGLSFDGAHAAVTLKEHTLFDDQGFRDYIPLDP